MSIVSAENKSNFAEFRKELEECFIELDTVPREVVSRMADVGINVTKKNTPVNKGPYVVGGTLRKAWKKTKVKKHGNSFVSGYSNNTEYAMYVNNGHRVVNGEKITVGYVEPVKMLEQGMKEAEAQTQTLFEIEVAKIKRKSGF